MRNFLSRVEVELGIGAEELGELREAAVKPEIPDDFFHFSTDALDLCEADLVDLDFGVRSVVVWYRALYAYHFFPFGIAD